MAAPILCEFRTSEITNIDRMDGNDMTLSFKVRYRKASDPDDDPYYIPVTTVKNVMGLIIPYFDPESVEPGVYVVHSYATASGPATGTKITINITCEDEPT